MVVNAQGKSVSKSVDGNVPQFYYVSGSIVSVSFQKQSEDGVLKVQIIRDDQVVIDSYKTFN